jgi:2-hydroxychromene-2-carboxylate isomerase
LKEEETTMTNKVRKEEEEDKSVITGVFEAPFQSLSCTSFWNDDEFEDLKASLTTASSCRKSENEDILNDQLLV